MRSLLSGYAASKLDTLRENALFMKGLTDGGQFVADLIMALSFEDEGRFVYDGFGDFNSYAKGKRVKKSKRKQTEHAVWG